MRLPLLSCLALNLVLATSVSAQSVSEAQTRAANVARMQAELINGGLGKYSPDDCMHHGGGGDCLVSNTSQGFRFRFLGGAPGWAYRNRPATLETEIFVSADGRISRVDYNGPVRTMTNP